MVKTISSRSSSRVLEQVDDQGMREGKGIHTIRDPRYQKRRRVQRRRWGGGWQHTRQTLEKSPTSKLYTTWAHILSDRNVFAPRGGGGKRRGPMPLGLFLFFFVVTCPSLPVFARPNKPSSHLSLYKLGLES